MNAPDNLFIPPHAIESEHSVLGALLIEGGIALDRIEGVLAADDFYRHEHQLIFTAIRTLSNAGRPIDVITVAEALEASGSLERIGGLPYLGNMAHNVPSAANIKRYAEIVKEHAARRALLALAEKIRTDCYAPGADVAQIISQADASMVQLLDGSANEPALLYDAFTAAIADIDERANKHCLSGLQTGASDIDEITGGLEPGQLVIVAARPSVGKTAFGLNIANYVVQQGETVAFFSLEMSNEELSRRAIALRSGVSVTDQRSGSLDDDQWKRVMACQDKSEGQRLFFIDKPAIVVPYARAVARKIKRQHGLGLIVVDYLGLMKGEGQNRTQEIGSLSRGLKALAKELRVPIIALAQLNRAVENRTDKRPLLSDLRDSGEIEQDADIVIMLHREEHHTSDALWKGLAEVMVRKNRNGPLGDFILRLDGPTMRFSSYEGQNPRKQFTPKPATQRSSYTRGIDD